MIDIKIKGDVQPVLCPLVMVSRNTSSNTAEITAPIQSNLLECGEVLSSGWLTKMASPSSMDIPTGMMLA